jgi:hypothetical protein
MPAHNERFGARGAVAPQKMLCKIERLSPALIFVEAPPLRQAAIPLSVILGRRSGKIVLKKIEK